MWLVAQKASNSPMQVTTMRLFDNQIEAETYANQLNGTVICYYFAKPNEKYSKRFEYYSDKYFSNRTVKANNSNFTP